MASPGLQSQSRRRLPRAPNIDASVQKVQCRDSVDIEQQQNMASIAKKRLTPEVVAMLLSLDYGSETTVNANKVVGSGISTKSVGEISQTPNTKVILQGDVGLVNILKTSGQPLGFSLRECNVNKCEEPGGIFVSRLTPGGVVEQNSLLSTGDEILEINCVAVKDYKLSDVVAMIQIPKKLTLKVRFKCRGDSSDVSKEHGTKKPKPSVRNVNNNYIEPNHRFECQRTGPKQGAQISAKESIITAPGALKFRRSSSGRLLPAPPESEVSISHFNTRHENRPSSYTSNIVSSDLSQLKHDNNTINLNTRLGSNSNFSENNSLSQRASQTHLNKEIVKIHSNAEISTSKQKSQKRSTVMPASINEKKPSQGTDSQDGRYTSKRLDPGDIKFDILASYDPKYSNFDSASNIISRTLDEIKIESKEVDLSKSTLRKTSETFGSSSSLSSNGSPKPQVRKSKNSSSSLETSGLSRSDMLAHSSRLSDNSPVSSSAENEDQMSKGVSENSIKQNQKPPFTHSLSSDDLNRSHNSWFSKIGHLKHVRKFSEGARPLSKPAAFGEPYRVQESTDVSSDDAEHGYRLYPSTPQETASRAVTGMVTLDIVKGAQIGESITREKRKKTKVLCSVDSDGVRQACTVSKKGINDFQWNESFEIELQRTREIRITVCSHSKKEDVKIAEGCLSLASLLNEGNEHLLAVCLEPFGMLCIKLKFTDMKFLLQRTPSQKKEGVFGFPLETVLRREGSKIPNLIRKCVEEINERGLETTGIYRICGNAAKKKVLRAQFDNNSASVDLSQTENPIDINIITGLLKDYLRELPRPLLSQDIRELLCETDAVPDNPRDNLASEIIKKFTRTSKATIMYLLDHFVTVLMNSDANKMDSHNLAVCIGPVLLCPSLGGSTTSTVSDTKKDISAIKLLLEVWPKPEQVSAC